jgi:hypothetical protein
MFTRYKTVMFTRYKTVMFTIKTVMFTIKTVTPWSLYLVFLLYVWVGQGVTWVYMLYFVLGFVLIGSVYY